MLATVHGLVGTRTQDDAPDLSRVPQARLNEERHLWQRCGGRQAVEPTRLPGPQPSAAVRDRCPAARARVPGIHKEASGNVIQHPPEARNLVVEMLSLPPGQDCLSNQYPPTHPVESLSLFLAHVEEDPCTRVARAP